MTNNLKKYNKKESKNNPQFNLAEHKKKALEDGDKQKLVTIERLENEIEKLLIIQQIRENEKLLNIYRNDINNAMQEGSYNLIEMILLKEIELLSIGDFEAIEMLDKLKKKAQEKIKKLSEIALQIHQNQLKISQETSSSLAPMFYSRPAESYETFTKYEGFHLEKTMGGEFIQTLDADIKNLVGSEIVNSKPEQLSQNIISEIKNIRKGNFETLNENNNINTSAEHSNTNTSNNNNNSVIKKNLQPTNSAPSAGNRSIKGEWTDLVNNQEKQQNHEIGSEHLVTIHKK
jgi:hypothetical protein